MHLPLFEGLVLPVLQLLKWAVTMMMMGLGLEGFSTLLHTGERSGGSGAYCLAFTPEFGDVEEVVVRWHILLALLLYCVSDECLLIHVG